MDIYGHAWGKNLNQMEWFGSIFQAEYNKSKVAEAMKEYDLASSESSDEYPGKQVAMGFMGSGV